MTEAGAEGTTLTAVARRAGVTRATVYLRWPTRSALIGAAARVGVGGTPMHLSGDVEADIRFGATFIGRIFDSPTFQALLPEIVRGVLAHPQDVSFDAVAPRRRDFGRIYRERAAADGFDPDVDPYLAFDMLLGTAIAYLLANGRPMPEAEAERVADVVIKGLRRSTPSA